MDEDRGLFWEIVVEPIKFLFRVWGYGVLLSIYFYLVMLATYMLSICDSPCLWNVILYGGILPFLSGLFIYLFDKIKTKIRELNEEEEE